MGAAVGWEGLGAIRLPSCQIPYLATRDATPVRILVDRLGGRRQVAAAAGRAIRRRRRSVVGFVTRVHGHSSALMRADRTTGRDRRGGQGSGKLCYESVQYTRSTSAHDNERGVFARSSVGDATPGRRPCYTEDPFLRYRLHQPTPSPKWTARGAFASCQPCFTPDLQRCCRTRRVV